ncbi:MAG: DNA polymerase/3'-5' exonuclease PolX [Bernardetiaceae bacterium]|nr:DNA polymerase/3'-5' exonuclease PolX [Bernardetiaceae bacterium]
MTNKAITRALRLMAALIELHGGNPHKARAYENAAMRINSADFELAQAESTARKKLTLSARMIEIAEDLIQKGTFEELEEMRAQTPIGVVDMLDIKGLGTKKVRDLWQNLHIDSIESLRKACEQGSVAKLKGFGQKTQEKILQALDFKEEQSGKWLFPKALQWAEEIIQYLEKEASAEQISLTGELRRALPVIENITIIAITQSRQKLRECLSENELFIYDKKNSGVFVWRGTYGEEQIPLELHLMNSKQYAQALLLYTASEAHLTRPIEGFPSVRTAIKNTKPESEADFYQKIKLPYLAPECREGLFEFDKSIDEQALIQKKDIKGLLHAHSTYSDGQASIVDMAKACQEKGYTYLGLTDHSVAAFYANGLNVAAVRKQHKEIEDLNQKNPDFKIFKGIEADILANGDLDYDPDTLASFDFVIASIHSSLSMDIQKATQRMLKAIQNPLTTILGHPTGRLLLRREGYPLDFEQIIEACAEYEVAIEINANPYRLDLDWRWVHFAIEKGVKIAICPDAHSIEGINDVQYGVGIARKGGAKPEHILNTMKAEDFATYIQRKK